MVRFKRKTKNLFNFRSINKNVADIRLLGHSVCDRLLDELVDFLFGVEVRSSDIAVDFDISLLVGEMKNNINELVWRGLSRSSCVRT